MICMLTFPCSKIRLVQSVQSISTSSSLQCDSTALGDSPYCLMPPEKEMMTYTFQPQQQSSEDDLFDDPVYASMCTVGGRRCPSQSQVLGTGSIANNKRTESSFNLLGPEACGVCTSKAQVAFPHERRCVPAPSSMPSRPQ